MRFLNTLYIGETARAKAEQIMDDVRSGRYVKDIYVLIEPLSDGNQIEVLQSYYLRQRYYQEMDPMILGIAKGKSEALELVRQLTEEALNRFGRPDLRAYVRLLVQGGDALA